MSIFGIVVTLLYVCGIAYLRWDSFSLLNSMPLNEFGDFFAGVFGPLMLFWLILSYMQQQKGLEQNTEALKLQAGELRESVAQHKELVITTQQQLQIDKQFIELEIIRQKQESEPNLALVSTKWETKGTSGVNYVFVIKNVGRPASDIRFSTDPEIKEICSTLPYLGQGEEYDFRFNIKLPPSTFEFIVDYKGLNKDEHKKIFTLAIDSESRYAIT